VVQPPPGASVLGLSHTGGGALWNLLKWQHGVGFSGIFFVMKDSIPEKDALPSHPPHDKDMAAIIAAPDQPSSDERRMHLKEGPFLSERWGPPNTI
jgi:hypothetical protein